MGIPLNSSASGTPPAGDQANAVITGTIAAVGPTAPFAFYGAFNLVMWGSIVHTLTTTSGSNSASVNSATGLVIGQTINSVNVPAGTTIGALSGTTITLAFPPGSTNANVASGADAAAVFMSVATADTVQLERTFDGGATWLICGIGGAGQQAIYISPSCISIVAGEPEKGVSYRLNCTVYAAGVTLNYRISATGILATSNGIPPG